MAGAARGAGGREGGSVLCVSLSESRALGGVNARLGLSPHIYVPGPLHACHSPLSHVDPATITATQLTWNTHAHCYNTWMALTPSLTPASPAQKPACPLLEASTQPLQEILHHVPLCVTSLCFGQSARPEPPKSVGEVRAKIHS